MRVKNKKIPIFSFIMMIILIYSYLNNEVMIKFMPLLAHVNFLHFFINFLAFSVFSVIGELRGGTKNIILVVLFLIAENLLLLILMNKFAVGFSGVVYGVLSYTVMLEISKNMDNVFSYILVLSLSWLIIFLPFETILEKMIFSEAHGFGLLFGIILGMLVGEANE